MLRELGQPSGEQKREFWGGAVVHLPAGPYTSSVCMLGTGWDGNSTRNQSSLSRQENEKKKMQAESKYLVQTRLRGFFNRPVALVGAGSRLRCGLLVGDRGRPLTRVT